MSINAINSTTNLANVQKTNLTSAKNIEQKTVSFKGEDSVELSTKKDIPVKKEASSGKKWGVGIASFFIPGLGQAINGEWGKAAGFFLGTGALCMASGVALATGPLAIGTLALAQLGMIFWRVADAVKSAKAE